MHGKIAGSSVLGIRETAHQAQRCTSAAGYSTLAGGAGWVWTPARREQLHGTWTAEEKPCAGIPGLAAQAASSCWKGCAASAEVHAAVACIHLQTSWVPAHVISTSPPFIASRCLLQSAPSSSRATRRDHSCEVQGQISTVHITCQELSTA